MLNTEYVGIFTSDSKVANKMLQTMEKYENDRWWLSDDPNYMAYKQFQEDTMLIESEAWQKATESLLGRKVSFVEFRLNFNGLKNEVITKYLSKH